MTTRVVIRCV